ncbi:metal-dependent hydrolase [Patescibacteria group bacterium]
MTGISHLIIGGSISVATLSLATDDPVQLIMGTAIGTTASILPDIDAENSLFQVAVDLKYPKATNTIISRYRRNFIEDVLYMLLSTIEIAIRVVIVSLIGILKSFTKHRGSIHSLTAMAIFALVGIAISYIFQVDYIYSIVFAIGYTTHLLSDALTVSGVKLFSPFSKRIINLLPKQSSLKTRNRMSLEEALVVSIVASLSFLVIIYFA